MQRIEAQITLTPEQAGERLDRVLAACWPEFSRSRISAWIKSGAITVDSQRVRPRHAVAGGESVNLSAELAPHADNRPQPIELTVIHEEPEFVIVDKPPGLVVHPGSGNPDGTLVNALLHYDPELAVLPRAGLVHRLDKDTSGCLLVARTLASHKRLVAMMKRREIKRHYRTVVWGHPIAGETIDRPLGRHPVDRRRQVVRDDGRRAVTRYRVARRLAGGSVLDVALETGRTHQIRVHLAHAGYPVVGDPVYGRRGVPAGLSEEQRSTWRGFPRQALHAAELSLPHPDDGRTVQARAPLPADMHALIEVLARDED